VAKKKTDETAFEPSMTRLEEIVRLLEGGTQTLEESLALFEEGVKLSRRCLAVLNDAERKVERLVGQDGRTEPFGLDDTDDAAPEAELDR
jgi:exodeoxyribonuclease VII small subunit